ncbi:ATP-binding protein [Ramlibacter sp.]|uniref:ATP-binding protein n=1 Tax=Ramlibacter sp. TaxID=1917967 RepID=UPI003D0B8D81
MSAGARPGHAEFRLRAELAEVTRVAAELRALMPGRLAPDACHAIEIAVAEAMTNIVKHAYAGRPAGAGVALSWDECDEALEIELRDEGAAMDASALEAASPAVFEFDAADLQSLPEGGMGLALIKMAFDDVAYSRVAGVNRLRLVKRLRA